MEFGDILRELLENNELNQKMLADELHISPAAIGNYVRGNRAPDYQTLKKIADFFHVSTDYLLDHPSENGLDHRDRKLLQIFHSLNEAQKELFLEQGKLLIRCNYPPERPYSGPKE